MKRQLPLLGALILVLVACTSAIPTPIDTTAASPTPTLASTPATPAPAETVPLALTQREGPRRQTSGSVPHVQLDPATVPEIDAELRRRVFLLPGVEDRESAISLPGAQGLWLSDETPIIVGGALIGREFAHIHPDGSLHVWLPVDRAIEVDRTKWGELHPWVDRDGFWDGVAMIYTPETADELDVTIQLIVDAYNFITGSAVDAADVA